eukprot:GEZU01019883.1.p2 GENE.GEZU01019883.1~~GEZU01019883.1.p2  ORF type:complete len:268 (+),score=97.55 GEZU01019883.1:48-806(+)
MQQLNSVTAALICSATAVASLAAAYWCGKKSASCAKQQQQQPKVQKAPLSPVSPIVPGAAYQTISEQHLEEDLMYRYAYLCSFCNFGEKDIELIHAVAPKLAPLVPKIVDAVYVKLFSYDVTKKQFMPRNTGYTGALPVTLEELTLDHDQIKYRKKFLGKYLEKLVTAKYDESLVIYLDKVGKMHTTVGGNSRLKVPLVHMNALMGFVADALTAIIADIMSEDSKETQLATIRAFNKLLWIQNDLITRHYQA